MKKSVRGENFVLSPIAWPRVLRSSRSTQEQLFRFRCIDAAASSGSSSTAASKSQLARGLGSPRREKKSSSQSKRPIVCAVLVPNQLGLWRSGSAGPRKKISSVLRMIMVESAEHVFAQPRRVFYKAWPVRKARGCLARMRSITCSSTS